MLFDLNEVCDAFMFSTIETLFFVTRTDPLQKDELSSRSDLGNFIAEVKSTNFDFRKLLRTHIAKRLPYPCEIITCKADGDDDGLKMKKQQFVPLGNRKSWNQLRHLTALHLRRIMSNALFSCEEEYIYE